MMGAVLLLLLPLLHGGASATTLFLAPTGRNAGPCSSSDPCNSLAAAANATAGGEVNVLIAPGVYHEPQATLMSHIFDCSSIALLGPSTLPAAIIVFSSPTTLKFGATRVVVQGLAFEGSSSPMLLRTLSTASFASLVVRNCTLRGQGRLVELLQPSVDMAVTIDGVSVDQLLQTPWLWLSENGTPSAGARCTLNVTGLLVQGASVDPGSLPLLLTSFACRVNVDHCTVRSSTASVISAYSFDKANPVSLSHLLVQDAHWTNVHPLGGVYSDGQWAMSDCLVQARTGPYEAAVTLAVADSATAAAGIVVRNSLFLGPGPALSVGSKSRLPVQVALLQNQFSNSDAQVSAVSVNMPSVAWTSQGNTWESNSAGQAAGGGLSVAGADSSIVFEQDTFELNTAATGGAVSLQCGAAVVFGDASFDDNSATSGPGGAIAVSSTVRLQLNLCSFSSNRAYSGSSVLACDGSHLVLNGTNLTDSGSSALDVACRSSCNVTALAGSQDPCVSVPSPLSPMVIALSVGALLLAVLAAVVIVAMVRKHRRSHVKLYAPV